ncbi:urease accessory protein UreD [Chroococcidiopsis sp. TS-821]|uniref:urease accessory protein UreD n=1 Tax=Chroococcidiopsis sp. TS-821 TaxID=1378066 RepID=UPI000CEF1489|nr:urease accessory protein UreD [Chroococcidiopsis sp. TS-821]PPS41430.1 urease accessory protein [Chroococcidiopsis sp. TS-821]
MSRLLGLKNSQKPNSWHGSLNMVYTSVGGTTTVTHQQMQAPLKVQRPFYPEGTEVCHSIILHTAGGVVGGDKLSLNLHLQPQAHTLITTAAASKIYRSNGWEARQNIQVTVDSHACLEWFPQETIVFNGAIYRQDLRIELAPGATWVGWEITRFGRSARGEKFLQGNWRSHTEVWQQQRPLWIDRQRLRPDAEVINSPHALAGKPIIGSFVWIGQSVPPDVVEKVRMLSTLDQGEAGVTRLTTGLLCRYRGDSTTEVRQWFTEIWHLLRLSFLGKPGYQSRVWQIERN